MWLKENKDNLRTIKYKILVAKRNKPEWNESFRHNAKPTSFTSPTGPRRQGSEQEHAQYRTNHDVMSGWSCRRPENLSILSSLLSFWRLRLFKSTLCHVQSRDRLSRRVAGE